MQLKLIIIILFIIYDFGMLLGVGVYGRTKYTIDRYCH